MYVLLMILTILAVLLLVIVLAWFLTNIIDLLNSIGGDGNSYLARLRLGLRAIETETGHLAGQITRLNAGLESTGEGLSTIDRHLDETIEAVVAQEKK